MIDNKTEANNLAGIFAAFMEEMTKDRHTKIDRATLMSVLEEVFREALVKKYGDASNFNIIINVNQGDFSINRTREVVETVTDPNKEISIEEVHKVDDSFEVGEEYSEPVYLDSFGRRSILSMRQSLNAKLMVIEKTMALSKYKEKVGELYVGEVYQVWKREVIFRDENETELILPKENQIPSDYFHKNDTVKTIIESAEMDGTNPVIKLSRTSPLFLERLFEQEVPEILDDLITIKKIVRVPGVRAKVAVDTYDDRIDPVGACVGVKGSRIRGIVHELCNENIDVIRWTTNTELLVSRALAPAKIAPPQIDEENKHILVFLKPSEVALAIGKNGANIKLAGELCGYTVDVYREAEEDTQEEDVLLTEFTDEIEPWIIETLQKMGCDTAKNVLALSTEDIVERSKHHDKDDNEKHYELDADTVEDVKKILNAEFADE
jgi:N utilization substance protein A